MSHTHDRNQHELAGEPVEANQVYRRVHRTEPDYERPLLDIDEAAEHRLRGLLTRLYGEDGSDQWYPELERLLQVYYAHKTEEMLQEDAAYSPRDCFTEKDLVLITYGDLVVSPDKPPLKALHDVLDAFARDVTAIHLLPFFPSSSDRGFAVIDYRSVDPDLGSWEDVDLLATRYRLMFDAVINHTSSKALWFRQYLDDNPDYADHYMAFTTREKLTEERLQLIMRPRASELFHEFHGLRGKRYVWTTFGPDQVDLNYHNPKVLMRVVSVLLYYVQRGADLLRLDAVTYLWDELGTRSVHLEQSHTIIKLFRAILDIVAPRVALVSETNVPHEENITYFGDGHDEAQMVYNFALPPLVLHTFQTGDVEALARWLADLEDVSDCATYLNFLDSHDGIGLLGARDILTDGQVAAMIETARAHGGLISHRTAEDGSEEPYEINITWWNAMNAHDSEEELGLQVDRYVASRAVALVLKGVPAVYLVGMLAGENDQESVQETGEARAINRRALDVEALCEMLESDGRTGRVTRRLQLLRGIRVRHPAFHPNAPQTVLDGGPGVLAVLRRSPDHHRPMLCLISVVGEDRDVRIDLGGAGLDAVTDWVDAISDQRLQARDGHLAASLGPYRVCWLVFGDDPTLDRGGDE